ncbi:MAG: relaxase/mobilization nuclease domain-containing protein [Acidobacteriota bacterium]
MPILKISVGGDSSKMASYLLNQNEARNRVQAVGGNVTGRSAESVEREFKAARSQFGQEGGRQYYHVAISFERSDLGTLARPDGGPDHAKLRDYGEGWAREAGIAEKHDYLVVVHGEKGYPHVHVLWNATGCDGRKYHHDNHNLDRLRDVNDRLARQHGIRRELDRVRDPHRPSDRFIRQAERGGNRYSWKLDVQDRIREAGRRAFSEEEFKSRLKEQGVELRIRGEKYSYAMTDEMGRQRAIREVKLGEPYQRQVLLEKLGQQKEQLRRDPEGYERRLKQERTERYSWQRDLRGRIIEALRPAKNHEAFREAMERQGVKAHLDEDGLYRFSFQDRHGLDHTEVSAAKLYSATPDRITSRIEENAGRAEAATALSVGKMAGREAGGLVASLMREIESATREPYGGRGGEGLPAREDIRTERPRRPEGLEERGESR